LLRRIAELEQHAPDHLAHVKIDFLGDQVVESEGWVVVETLDDGWTILQNKDTGAVRGEWPDLEHATGIDLCFL